jgi:thioredoxin-dependent peroxiredoxin
MLQMGSVAPDFAIGESTLYEALERGPAVVFFFPKAFTPICTREAGEFRREFERLQRSACSVVGVSGDSQEENDSFRESLELPYPLVGDPNGTIRRAYDVRWPILGMAQRVTYVISPHRQIRVAFHSEFRFDAHVAKACEAVADIAS